MIFASFTVLWVKSFRWKSQSLPPAKDSMMGEVSSNCQRRKAGVPGTSGADSPALHQDATWNHFLLE
jgi:hypothetical protein